MNQFYPNCSKTLDARATSGNLKMIAIDLKWEIEKCFDKTFTNIVANILRSRNCIFSENHFLSSLTSSDPSRRFAKMPDLLAYQKAATLVQFQYFVTFDLRYPMYIMNQKLPQNFIGLEASTVNETLNW